MNKRELALEMNWIRYPVGNIHQRCTESIKKFNKFKEEIINSNIESKRELFKELNWYIYSVQSIVSDTITLRDSIREYQRKLMKSHIAETEIINKYKRI